MARIAEYCHQWRLKPSTTKTVSSVFHLHNVSAGRELTVTLNGARLKHDEHVYLGVTLDRTLSYKEHLIKTAGKLKMRNNLLTKLKLRKHHSSCDAQHHFFSERVVTRWNSLSQEAVSAPSLNSFKNRLNKFTCEDGLLHGHVCPLSLEADLIRGLHHS